VKFQGFTAIFVTAVLAPVATVQAQLPTAGDYNCKMDFMHMMKGDTGMAMINAATCTLEGDDKNVTTFTNNVMFDDKGTGKLINSNGLTEVEGNPASAFIGIDSTWLLQMKDGQMTGYTADGVNEIVAGENVGKKIYWTASPTGPDTAKISYEIKD